MTYFVKKRKASEVEGPFSIDQINQMVLQGRLAFNSLAIENIGQSLEEIGDTPKREWRKLAEIKGFEPNPDQEKGCLVLMLVGILVIGAIVVIGLIKLNEILHRIH